MDNVYMNVFSYVRYEIITYHDYCIPTHYDMIIIMICSLPAV